jgi:adenosylhomocysteine nucleosidase
MKVAVFAALTQELKPLVRRLKAVRGVGSHCYKIYLAADSSNQIILVMTGMGIANASDAVHHVCSEYKPDVAVSIGYGGALYAGARGGEIVMGLGGMSINASGSLAGHKIYRTPDVLDKMNISLPIKLGTIVTLPGLIKKSEIIAKLPANVQNPVCDMETYAYADYCEDIGIRFFAIRGITDLGNQDITQDIAGIMDEFGKVDVIKAIITILKSPRVFPSVIRLGIYSRRASRNLRTVTMSLLEALH